MLAAYEGWLAAESLPPVTPWDGVRRAPWDPTQDLALPTTLDGTFTGLDARRPRRGFTRPLPRRRERRVGAERLWPAEGAVQLPLLVVHALGEAHAPALPGARRLPDRPGLRPRRNAPLGNAVHRHVQRPAPELARQRHIVRSGYAGTHLDRGPANRAGHTRPASGRGVPPLPPRPPRALPPLARPRRSAPAATARYGPARGLAADRTAPGRQPSVALDVRRGLDGRVRSGHSRHDRRRRRNRVRVPRHRPRAEHRHRAALAQ